MEELLSIFPGRVCRVVLGSCSPPQNKVEEEAFAQCRKHQVRGLLQLTSTPRSLPKGKSPPLCLGRVGQAGEAAKAMTHPTPAINSPPQRAETADLLGVQGSCCQLPGGLAGAAEPGVQLLGEEQPRFPELHLGGRSPAGLLSTRTCSSLLV